MQRMNRVYERNHQPTGRLGTARGCYFATRVSLRASHRSNATTTVAIAHQPPSTAARNMTTVSFHEDPCEPARACETLQGEHGAHIHATAREQPAGTPSALLLH